MLNVWVSVCVYGTFFRPGFGTLYLTGNRKTWPLTVKPHLTTPFRLCLAFPFEQSSMLFTCLELLGACSQASFGRKKLSITVCQLLQKKNGIFFFFFFFHSFYIGSRYCRHNRVTLACSAGIFWARECTFSY